MNIIGKFIVFWGGRTFHIKRTIKTFDPQPHIEELKVLFNCDTILKKDGIFYFCSEIPDAEILEEITTTS
jgi:hypothetical protein